jgi:hypothetical protein
MSSWAIITGVVCSPTVTRADTSMELRTWAANMTRSLPIAPFATVASDSSATTVCFHVHTHQRCLEENATRPLHPTRRALITQGRAPSLSDCFTRAACHSHSVPFLANLMYTATPPSHPRWRHLHLPNHQHGIGPQAQQRVWSGDDVIDLVDPHIGTGGDGFGVGGSPPGVQLPFGMIRASPDTCDANGIAIEFTHFGGWVNSTHAAAAARDSYHHHSCRPMHFRLARHTILLHNHRTFRRYPYVKLRRSCTNARASTPVAKHTNARVVTIWPARSSARRQGPFPRVSWDAARHSD